MTLAPASPDRREGPTLPWFIAAGIRPQTLSRYFAPLWSPPAAQGRGSAVDPRSEHPTR